MIQSLRIFFKTALPVAILIALLAVPVEALADHSGPKRKKGFSSGVRSTLTQLRSKNVYISKTASASRSIADTAARIQSVKTSGDKCEVKLSLPSEVSQIEISIHNILGRKMPDTWKGEPRKDSELYELSINGLPEGMYICVVQGKNFRLAEKFIISR